MPDSRNYYVLCEDNCRFPGMTAEQILEAIAEATGETPTHVDDAFITKIKESNHNYNLTFWKGTEAEFNALSVTATAYKVEIDANHKLYFTPVEVSPITPLSAEIGTTWSGSAAPYSQNIIVQGVLANDNPIIDIVPSSTFATAETQLEEWGKIFKITAGANSITVYATEPTEVAIPIKILCVRS